MILATPSSTADASSSSLRPLAPCRTSGIVDGGADGLQALELQAAGGRSAVRVADGDGEPVDVGRFDETCGLVGIGPGGVADRDAGFVAGDVAEFGFERQSRPADQRAGLAGERDVLVEGEGGTVDHDGAEAGVDGEIEFVEGVGVIEVEGNLRLAVL